MRAFLFLFLLFPLIELAVLIQVGSAIGVLPTLLLVIGTAVLGSVLLRVAGVATAWRARERLARGEVPEQEMLEGLLIAVGGGLLLLPGFISDIFGLLCLIPFTRRLFIRNLRKRAETGLLAQMTETPTSPWTAELTPPSYPFAGDWRPHGTIVHVFTHFRLELQVWSATTPEPASLEDGWWTSPAELDAEALPTLFRKVLAAALG